MQLNFINKIYICTTIILVLATFYKVVAYKGWERYNYSSAVTAPETFPVFLREAYFILPDGDSEFITEKDVNNFTTRWGADYGSSSEVNLKRLPIQLVLKYVSYRDRKFYSDTLALPQKEMGSIFYSASTKRQFLKLSSYAGDRWGLAFVIGLANNGNLTLWLRGVNLEKQLLKVKLKSVEPKPDDLYFERRISKAEYFKKAFENLSDSVKTLLDGGFDEKANYIDTPSRYIENNTELWKYQKENGFIK